MVKVIGNSIQYRNRNIFSTSTSAYVSKCCNQTQKNLELKKFYRENCVGAKSFYRYCGLPVPVQGYTVQG